MRPVRSLAVFVALATITLAAAASPQEPLGAGWPTYGGDPGGSRFSSSSQIDRTNLSRLHPVWTFHTHALDSQRSGSNAASFESTPVLSHGTLFFTSPFDVVFAVDALNGRLRWSYDPKIKTLPEGTLVTSRGVAVWEADSSSASAPCSRRVLLGTLDARLLALDAETGQPCGTFGNSGSVDLTQGIAYGGLGFYGVTSAPTVIGNVAVVGSSIGDNQRVDAESGAVRGFDIVTGKQLWSWEPLPWAPSQHPRTGAGNAWSTISADPILGLVFIPTGSPSPDFYGGLRPGDDRDADSVVALDGRTGKRVWAFQTAHHNLWDYDLAAEPLLFTFRATTPAVAIATKSGQVFVLDRRTGDPLYPVIERSVPQTDVPGESTSPTQPFSSLPPLAPLDPPSADTTDWKRSEANINFCRTQLSHLRYAGIFTPPSLSGTLLYPGSLGGVNWGSLALDPATGTLFANNNRVPFAIQLLPRNKLSVRWHHDIEPTIRDWPFWVVLALFTLFAFCIARKRFSPGVKGLLVAMAVASIAGFVCIFPMHYDSHFGSETSPQFGSPYLLKRWQVVDHDGNPCTAPPWSRLTAMNLNTGTIAWETTLGTNAKGLPTGGLTLGGPIVTAGGLIFTAATQDAKLRAFDAATGAELWNASLPAPAQATPMTYTTGGRQFVVIAAGGHAGFGEQRDDILVAFALSDSSPRP